MHRSELCPSRKAVQVPVFYFCSQVGTGIESSVCEMADISDAIPLLNSLRSATVAFFTFKGYLSLLEAFFLAVVLYFALTRAYLPRRSREGSNCSIPLDKAQIEAKIAAWTPAPLVEEVELIADVSNAANSEERLILTSAAGPVTTVRGINLPEVVNLSSFNFLGLVGNKTILDACALTMKRYGCGACGPRGFYGTTDVHLQCESAIAHMMGVEDAILYSFGSSTNASVIPAFCKRGDIVVCDKGVSFSIQTGISLSRADLHWFEHNDMNDLERVLTAVIGSDTKNPSKALEQRRFIIVEGVYAYHGDIAPLDRIVVLKNKFNFRLILDESFSLGVLGNTGRGALEHFSIPRSDVEIATADFGNAFASIGGMCVGERDVVSHQRLSGAGYCFSASQPPFLATSVTEAIKLLGYCGSSLIEQLRENTAFFRSTINIPKLRDAGWAVEGDHNSPLIHIRRAKDDMTRSEFLGLRHACLMKGLLVASPSYVESEAFGPRHGLRLAISAAHDMSHLEHAAKVLLDVLLDSNVS